MDPVNKRYVWSFIENFKKGRVIILTTHSMEEADILGDKIAVWLRDVVHTWETRSCLYEFVDYEQGASQGRWFRAAVGAREDTLWRTFAITILFHCSLKNKFGDGYRVSLVVPRSSDVPAVKAIVAETTPQALLIDEEYVGGDAAKKSEGAAAVAAAAKGAAANATSAKSSKKSVSSSAVDGVAAVAVDAGQTARLVYTLKDIKDVKRIVRVLEDDQKLNAKNGTTSMVSGWGMSQVCGRS